MTHIELNGRKLFKISMGWVMYNKPELVDLFATNNWITMGGATGKSQAINFRNYLSIGDLVYVCYGSYRLSYIAEVISESQLLPQDIQDDLDGGGNWIYRKVRPLYQPIVDNANDLKAHRSGYLPSANSTFAEVKPHNIGSANTLFFGPKYDVNFVNQFTQNNSTSNNIMKTDPQKLNVILYGPPGTGKTFHTVNKAIEIVDRNFSFTGKTRKQIADHFRSLIYDEEINPEGQIVFTTFHQSMSYEDFIEGIKPKLNDDIDDQSEDVAGASSDIEYEVKDGIFKSIVKLANKSTKNTVSFESIWDKYLEYLTNFNGEKIFSSISSELKLDSLEPNGNSINVRFKKSWNPDEPEGTRAFIVSKNMIERLFDAKVDGSDENKKGRTDVSKLVGKGRATHIYSVYKDFYSFAIENGAFTVGERLNYVIIIDEINRGNVSSIFGELITLIEKDKRKGEENELSVVLPYSRDKFSIPTNLYIIGTMNTADRSVEALDTALRRRFAFEEMLPESQTLADKGEDGQGNISGIHLPTLLTKINERIEALVDRDHTIGHAFFIANKNLDDLRNTFANKIIPLLQEYFYGNYEKMMMVIGKTFFHDEINASKIEFAVKLEDYQPEGKVLKLRDLTNEVNFTNKQFVFAIRKLINPKFTEVEVEQIQTEA